MVEAAGIEPMPAFLNRFKIFIKQWHMGLAPLFDGGKWRKVAKFTATLVFSYVSKTGLEIGFRLIASAK